VFAGGRRGRRLVEIGGDDAVTPRREPSAIALPMPDPAPVTTTRPPSEWVFIADESRFTVAAGSRIDGAAR